MRKFKDITKEELKAKVTETVYYYILSDLIESDEAKDKEAFDSALVSARDIWARQKEIIKTLCDTFTKHSDPEETYEEFEDLLLHQTERELY